MEAEMVSRSTEGRSVMSLSTLTLRHETVLVVVLSCEHT